MITICRNEHTEIVHSQDECPLCEMIKRAQHISHGMTMVMDRNKELVREITELKRQQREWKEKESGKKEVKDKDALDAYYEITYG